jgi:hypothetical protein
VVKTPLSGIQGDLPHLTGQHGRASRATRAAFS